jgi:hypothetical protein
LEAELLVGRSDNREDAVQRIDARGGASEESEEGEEEEDEDARTDKTEVEFSMNY